MNHITLTVGLVKIGELKAGRSGDKEWKALPITVAQNERVREVDASGQVSYKDLPSKYYQLTLWNWQAESFLKSTTPLGTKLLVTGKYKLEMRTGYTDKNGNEVPSQLVDTIEVEDIAVLLTNQPGKIVEVKSAGQGSSSQQRSTQSASSSVTTNNKRTQENKAASQPSSQSNDLFGDVEEEYTSDDSFDIFD